MECIVYSEIENERVCVRENAVLCVTVVLNKEKCLGK